MCSIAFINNLLSRLFGGEQDNSEDDGQLLEQELQPEQAPVPVKPHYELQLSSEHPLRRLWDFSCQQSGPFPGPEILLDEQTSEDLSEAEANRELRRLQQAISASASERLSRIQTKLDPAADAPLPAFDAKVAVITSSDNLIAWIVAYPPVGEGAELSQDCEIWGGYLERSNSDMVKQMTEMITYQRALQSAAQVTKMYDQLMTKATSDVGRFA